MPISRSDIRRSSEEAALVQIVGRHTRLRNSQEDRDTDKPRMPHKPNQASCISAQLILMLYHAKVDTRSKAIKPEAALA